jgi:DNA-binding GntR family transcriptional regulator
MLANKKENSMMATVAQMTREELKEMIETAVEQKLIEMFGDPDAGSEIREAVRDRLLRQRKAVVAGERGEPFEDVVRRLGLE